MNDELIALREEMRRGFADVRTDVGDVRQGLVEVRGELAELRGGLVEVRGELAELRGGLTEVRGGLAELHGGAADVRGGLVDVRGGLAEVREGLADVRGGLTGVRGGLAEVRGGLTGVRDDLTGVHQRLDSLEIRVRHDGVLVEALRDEFHQLAEAHVSLDQRIERHRVENDGAHQEILVLLRTSYRDLDRRVTRLETPHDEGTGES